MFHVQINEPTPQFFRQYWLFLALLLAATFILPLAGIPVAVILLWTVTTQSRQWVVAGPPEREGAWPAPKSVLACRI